MVGLRIGPNAPGNPGQMSRALTAYAYRLLKATPVIPGPRSAHLRGLSSVKTLKPWGFSLV